IGFDNYTKLFQDDLFWKTLLNTVIYLVGVVPALVIIPIFLAVLVNQKLKGVGFFRSAFFIPVVTSLVVAGIAWDWVYIENGLLIFSLQLARFIKELICWITSSCTDLFFFLDVIIRNYLVYFLFIILMLL